MRLFDSLCIPLFRILTRRCQPLCASQPERCHYMSHTDYPAHPPTVVSPIDFYRMPPRKKRDIPQEGNDDQEVQKSHKKACQCNSHQELKAARDDVENLHLQNRIGCFRLEVALHTLGCYSVYWNDRKCPLTGRFGSCKVGTDQKCYQVSCLDTVHLLSFCASSLPSVSMIL